MFASSNQVLTEVGTKLIQVAPKFNQSWIQLEMKPFTYSNEITQKMRMWKTPVENAKSSIIFVIAVWIINTIVVLRTIVRTKAKK